MFEALFQKTGVMWRDTKTAHRVYTGLAVISAATMFIAAAGSGNPQTAEPLPDWINIGANIASAIIGILVLMPRTRVLGAVLAALNMLLSMSANYMVDGPDYFLKVLPFNLVAIAVSVLVAWHYRDDVRLPKDSGQPH